MSEQMIARWNAIPLERPSEPTNLKRQGPDESDDDDDDMVSRSPSPASQIDMDVDEIGIQKYDEYVRKPVREVITVDTKIKPSNKGFALLTQLGWREGQPLGLSEDGRTEPVPFYIKSDLTGLGKISQDFEMIDTTVSQRRELDSEKQRRETEQQRRVREDSVARKSALEAELSSTLKSFYCELCDKQFKTVAQYDEHTNSYAHHHKARFKNMQANSRMDPQELDKLKEKERKREEKELRKMAAASGIKLPKAQMAARTQIAATDLPNTADAEKPEGRSGPNTSSNPTNVAARAGIPSGGFKKVGWTVVGATISTPQPPSNLPPPLPSESSDPRPPNPAPPPPAAQHTTSFRNAGWTTLETGHSHDVLSLPSTDSHNLKTASARPAKTFGPVAPTEILQPPPLSPNSIAARPVSVATPDVVRSNWQQFRKGGRK